MVPTADKALDPLHSQCAEVYSVMACIGKANGYFKERDWSIKNLKQTFALGAGVLLVS